VLSKIFSDFKQQMKRSKSLTQAFLEFLMNREQLGWEERLVLSAINKVNINFVAFQHGKSDRILAGDAGFEELYESYQAESY